MCATLSVLQLSPREGQVFYDVVAIVDPLTREAQKMSSLLLVRVLSLSFVFMCCDHVRFVLFAEDPFRKMNCDTQK